MSGETQVQPGDGDGDGKQGKPVMRDALVAAAFRLFLDRGFDQTTIDDIVELAGVGRRSFFRYFPSKEAVVFPDHERCLAEMEAFLAASEPDDDPVQRVCDGARLVARMYAESPAFSVQRYRLTRQVRGCAPTNSPSCGDMSECLPTTCAPDSPLDPTGLCGPM